MGERKRKTPKGHVVVYVGERTRRFVVPISCLRSPQLQGLFEESARVYGFRGNYGRIMLPCSESTFFRVLSSSEERDVDAISDLVRVFGGRWDDCDLISRWVKWVGDRIL